MKSFLVWLAFVLSYCETYKILVIYPLPGKSHSLLGNGIVRHLLKDGHEITYISAFTYEPASPNLRVIDVSANNKVVPDKVLSIEAIMNKEVDLQDPVTLFNLFIEVPKVTFKNENVQKLLNDPNEAFDVVIAEWMFSELLTGFAAVFNCPLIWTFSVDVHWAILRLIDQPTNPSYTADVMESNLPPFNFKERVTGLITQLTVKFLRDIYYDRLEKEVYENFIVPIIAKRGREAPNFYDLQYNASLVLANSHVSMGQAVALPQNYIPIGGFHIDEEVKQLPNDLKKILDDATNGAIYFSMGSNLKSKDLPNEIKVNLLAMFGRLQQTVLWKFEEDLPNKPKNVHILKWAPQQSILAHPNLILFITHGGLLSTTETIHFGVPIIGIPVFADQFSNVNRAQKRGYALRVDLSYTMADDLESAIEKMLTNPRYSETAKELSFVYHHRPVTPGKQVQHWVKHVIQTRGAPHLRSPALHVPFYQKLYLDLLAIVIITIFIFIKIVKLFLRAYCAKCNVNTKKKNN